MAIWTLWFIALPLGLIVALPIVFSEEPVVFDEWHSIPVPEPFGVTASTVITYSTAITATVGFKVEVGRSSPQNIYAPFSCAELDAALDSNGLFRVSVPQQNSCTQGGDHAVTAGGCCAPEHGWAQDGSVFWAFTGPGTVLTAAETQLMAPNVTTTSPISQTVDLVSTSFDRWLNGLVASAYNIPGGTVDVFTRPDGGSWTHRSSTACDGPFSNFHWGATAEPAGDRGWIVCRNGGPVNVFQIDLNTGATDWSSQIDFANGSSQFVYQQCDTCGSVERANGTNAEALACISRSNSGSEVCMIWDVGTLVQPTVVSCTSFPDAAADRQGFLCDGSMVYTHGRDPDGTGVLTRVINFGFLDGSPISLVEEDNSRSATFAGFPLDSAPAYPTPGPTPTPPVPSGREAPEGTGPPPHEGIANVSSIRYSRYPVVEGYNPAGGGSDVVRFGALTVPFFFDTFEGGDLRFWDTVVGGSASP